MLVEDAPADAALIHEALLRCNFRIRFNHVNDGVDALAYLRREGDFRKTPQPDLVLLDLSLPRKCGCEFLSELREDENSVPIVVLTDSDKEVDILAAYGLHANCYLSKPGDLEEFITLFNTIGEFWFKIAQLPPKE